MRKFRSAATACAVAALAATTLGLSSASASASTQSDFNSTGVRIHSSATLGSSTKGEGNPGDGMTVGDYVIGDWVADCGNGIKQTNAWAHITDNRTHVSGYIVSCYIGPL
jgi:hypothetical protein